MEYSLGSIPLPPGWDRETDFVFGRIMFPGGPLDGYAGARIPTIIAGDRCGPRIIPAPTGISWKPCGG